jgi:hypothetical protein
MSHHICLYKKLKLVVKNLYSIYVWGSEFNLQQSTPIKKKKTKVVDIVYRGTNLATTLYLLYANKLNLVTKILKTN